MADIVTRTFVLTGGRTGQTVVLGKSYRFVDGMMTVRGNGNDVECIAHFIGRSYQAFEKGSDKLKAAQEAYNGKRDIPEAKKPENPKPVVLGGVQPNGPGAVPETTVNDGGSGNADSGEAGVLSNGDGHEDSRIHRIKESLSQLDTVNDEHWVADGRPAVAAVEHFLKDKTTRAEIEEAAPNFTREG